MLGLDAVANAESFTLAAVSNTVKEGGAMEDEIHNPQINISKITVGGGIAGAFFTAVSTLIFLMGVPLVRLMFPVALLLGGGIALALHLARHKAIGTPWILSGTKR